MIQEFTVQEKKKAKQAYKKEQKFNPTNHSKEKLKLQAYAIDTKKKYKSSFAIGYGSMLIIT